MCLLSRAFHSIFTKPFQTSADAVRMIQQQEINRALIVEKIGPDAQYKIVEEAVPVPKDDEVLIRLSYTGVWYGTHPEPSQYAR